MITELEPNNVFVFGSNRNGAHGGGAAALAHKRFGAAWGVGEGLTGQAYAFPTLDTHMQQLSEDELELAANNFRKTALALPAVTFYVTKVGCGIAKFSEKYMKTFFKDMPDNVVLPDGWREV